MTTSTDAYLVRELLPSDGDAVLALLTASLAGGPTGERTAEFLRWKHQLNPFGVSPGLVAVTEAGEIAAVRLLLRWELRCGERTVRAHAAVGEAAVLAGAPHQFTGVGVAIGAGDHLGAGRGDGGVLRGGRG